MALPAYKPCLQPLVGAKEQRAPLLCPCMQMAFIPIGSSLERSLGSVQLLWLMGVLCVLGDMAYIAIAYLGTFSSIE